MKKKTFVIDTNVFLHDPDCLFKFPYSQIVIPLTVLEELDRMKRSPYELGKNARRIFRHIDLLTKSGKGDVHSGISFGNHATLRIYIGQKSKIETDLPLTVEENRIIAAALQLKAHGERIIFVSKGLASRIKAEAVGLEAEDYENLKYAYETMYRGIKSIDISKSAIDAYYKDGIYITKPGEWLANEYCAMRSPENSSALGRFDAAKKGVVPLIQVPDLWGVTPRNVEQRCAVDALLRDEIKLVTLIGPAGTGKTLLALACALRKVFDEGKYVRILVSRPVIPLGRDIGYLPGTKEEKLFHWMQPIYDNLEFLCQSADGGPNDTMNWVMESQKLEMEAVSYIRGRSLPNAFIIVDEAQNLTPHEMKTIISRAGDGTKVVLTGDPTQIDNPYLDKDSNGLTYTVGRFGGHKLYGHLFLEKTERSELAALAAEIL